MIITIVTTTIMTIIIIIIIRKLIEFQYFVLNIKSISKI